MVVIIVLINGYKNIFFELQKENEYYIILLNFTIAILSLLYMFNIIPHKKDNKWILGLYIIISFIGIFLKLKLTLCMCLIFFATYIFFKSPKNFELKENDFISKWIGFKRYLEDYSILNQQEENAKLIWDKYLIYALSLGINKKIVQKYGKLSKEILIDENYCKRFYIEYFE